MSLRHAVGGIVRPTLLPGTDGGTEKQEKLCCRCRIAVVVVVAATRTSVGHVSGCRFFVINLRRISSWGTRKHKTNSSTYTKGSRDRPTSRAYSGADPGLVCPAAAAATATARSAVAAADYV